MTESSIVYSKTAKGITEVSRASSSLPRALRAILKEIDGKTPASELRSRFSKHSDADWRKFLQVLENDGYMRDASPTPAPVLVKATRGNEEVDLDFTSIAAQPAKELSPAEKRAAAKRDAEQKIELLAHIRARQESEVQARQTSADKARRDADEKVKQALLAKVKQETEERAKREAEAKARREAEAKAKLDAEEKVRRDAETKARKEVQARERREAQERARLEAVEQARREAEERARLEAAEKARRDAEQKRKRDEAAAAAAKAEEEKRAREEAELQRQREAREKARLEAIEKTRREAEARARQEAEAQARREAEERARQLADEKRRHEAEEKARLEAEEKAQREAEQQARIEAENRARREAEERAKREAEERERAAAEAQARLEAESRAKAEAEKKARLAAEEQAQRERDDAMRREADMQAQREADERARREAEEKARVEAEELQRREEEAQARRDAEEKARQAAEAEAQRRREAEEAIRREAEELERQAAAERARLEAESRAKAEAEEKARLAAEEEVQREREEAARREAEAQARLEVEARAKAEAEEQARLAAEERARREREDEERRQTEERARKEAEEAERLEAERLQRLAVWERAKLKAEARLEQEVADKARRDAEEKARAEEAERVRREGEALAVTKGAALQMEDEELAQRKARIEAELAAAELAARRAQQVRKLSEVKWGKVAVIVIVFALVFALVRLHIVSFDERIPEVQAAASERLGQPVTVDALYFSLYPRPRWHVQGVKVGGAEQITAHDIDAFIDVRRTFSEGWSFSNLTLRSPYIKQEALAWLLYSKASSRTLSVASVKLRDATLLSPGIDVPRFDADAALEADGNWRQVDINFGNRDALVTLRSDGGRIQYELTSISFLPPFGGTFAFDDFTARGAFDRNGITVEEFEGRNFGGTLTGKARIDWTDAWSIAGTVKARQPDARRLAPALLGGGRVDGLATFTMHAKDARTLFAAPRLEGDFSVSQGEVLGIDLMHLLKNGGDTRKTAFRQLTGKFVRDGDTIELRQVRLDSGMLSAAGALDILDNGLLRGRFTTSLTFDGRQSSGAFNLNGTREAPKFSR